jgi:hypothetical protein
VRASQLPLPEPFCVNFAFLNPRATSELSFVFIPEWLLVVVLVAVGAVLGGLAVLRETQAGCRRTTRTTTASEWKAMRAI